MYYILNAAGSIVAVASYRPEKRDLRERGERAVEADDDIPLQEALVENFPAAPRIVRRDPQAEPHIKLVVSAKDADGDGVPELAADGRSRAGIVAMVLDPQGRPIHAPVEIAFRTTAGSLSRRTVTTEDGRAEVALRSSRETVAATVSASARGFVAASTQIEFIPVESK